MTPDAVQPADLIFVMAGRMERKQYGLELYRSGVSPKLVLSVGRFEVSKMTKLALECVDELIALRDQTPPDERQRRYVVQEMIKLTGYRVILSMPHRVVRWIMRLK